MLTANIPAGVSALRAAAANSVDVRCAGVADADPDPPGTAAAAAARLAKRQPFPDQIHHLGVGVDSELAGSGPACRDVPGQAQRAAAQVEYSQWLAGRPGKVEQVAKAPHVLEIEVQRIIEVDRRLRRAAH